MKTITLSISLLCCFAVGGLAQSADKVGRLVAQENYFAALAKEKGTKSAFLRVSDAATLLFKPGPVKALPFFKDNANADSGTLFWMPAFARISKSDDWGFTSGPFVYRPDSASIVYGDYLSVWKKNKRGRWKLALDAGITHGKPSQDPKLVFINPQGDKFLHQYSPSRLQQREDIILSSDKLFGTILKADNKIARNEFLSEETRLLFPGEEPLIGKKAVLAFWEKQGGKLVSQPLAADRAYSGELAFTYGTAAFTQKGQNKNYNYIRIWEVQPAYNWSVIMEIYIPEK